MYIYIYIYIYVRIRIYVHIFVIVIYIHIYLFYLVISFSSSKAPSFLPSNSFGLLIFVISASLWQGRVVQNLYPRDTGW